MLIEKIDEFLNLTPDIEGTEHASALRVLAARRLAGVLATIAAVDPLALPKSHDIYDAICKIALCGEKGYGSISETHKAIHVLIAACLLAYGEPQEKQDKVFSYTLAVLHGVPLLQGEHYHMPLPDR